ncbi:MAG: hypothetical protein GWP69_07655 [Gammaproteobacteria bacterium]|nr:hypothetical protein [Gammaproteobacteria bacterium]
MVRILVWSHYRGGRGRLTGGHLSYLNAARREWLSFDGDYYGCSSDCDQRWGVHRDKDGSSRNAGKRSARLADFSIFNRLQAAYGPGKFEKLLALKQKYDPTNMFRMNQYIRPDINGVKQV